MSVKGSSSVSDLSPSAVSLDWEAETKSLLRAHKDAFRGALSQDGRGQIPSPKASLCKIKTFIFAFSSLSKRRGWGCILSYADDGVVRDQKPIHLPAEMGMLSLPI